MELSRAIRESWIRSWPVEVGGATVELTPPPLGAVNELDATLLLAEPDAVRAFELQGAETLERAAEREAAAESESESEGTPQEAPKVSEERVDELAAEISAARARGVGAGEAVLYEVHATDEGSGKPWTGLPARERFRLNAAVRRYERKFRRERARLCLAGVELADGEIDALLENHAKFRATVDKLTLEPPAGPPPSMSPDPT